MTIPDPLPDRAILVGGIESICLDGNLWYFGFDYSSDLVLSPLIDNAQQMSEFAARYMEQMDGKHDAAYWRQLVDWSATESGLASDVGDRTFATAQLIQISRQANAALAASKPIPGFSIPYHALYLLRAAVGDVPPPNDESYTSAMGKLRLDEDCSSVSGACEAMEMLAQTKPLPDGASFADAAAAVRLCLDALVNRAPGNWRMLFHPLVEE